MQRFTGRRGLLAVFASRPSFVLAGCLAAPPQDHSGDAGGNSPGSSTDGDATTSIHRAGIPSTPCPARPPATQAGCSDPQMAPRTRLAIKFMVVPSMWNRFSRPHTQAAVEGLDRHPYVPDGLRRREPIEIQVLAGHGGQVESP